MAFFDGFLNASPHSLTPQPASPFTATPISVEIKDDAEVVDSWTKLHLHMTCNSGVLIF